MKLNLCIDIDGTITDAYYWLEFVNNYFGINIKPFQVTTYEIHEVLNIPRKEYLKFYEIYGERMHAGVEIRKNAKQILWELSRQHNIYYVTAREPKMKKITEEWFYKQGLPKGELHLLGNHYKVDKARELNCDIFIEDRYENAIQLAKENFKVLLMDCYYNRNPLIEGITRVFGWKEILENIIQYTGKKNMDSTKIAG